MCLAASFSPPSLNTGFLSLTYTRNMAAADSFIEANKSYVASFGDKGSLPLPPGKRLTIGKTTLSVGMET